MEDKKFHLQQCQDEEITKSFRQLHNEVVDLIIKWCHDNGVVINEFHLNADCLEDSIKAGSWQPCTDSELSFMKKFDNNYEIERKNHEPHLYSM